MSFSTGDEVTLMGTNYYLSSSACPHCGRSDPELHIGKSSYGWCFGLHVIPAQGINSLNDYSSLIVTSGLLHRSTYGRPVTPEEMLDVITQRVGPTPKAGMNKPSLSPDWLRRNSACAGPNNLARAALEHGCIGHGEGTWDLLDCEFS